MRIFIWKVTFEATVPLLVISGCVLVMLTVIKQLSNHSFDRSESLAESTLNVSIEIKHHKASGIDVR